MSTPVTSADVRLRLVDALRLDLVGPSATLGNPAEVLPQSPSRWYLTGFLVPLEASASQRQDDTSDDDFDATVENEALDDITPEPAAARQRYLPSSIGLSILVPAAATTLQVSVTWGDYRRQPGRDELWTRQPREGAVSIDLSKARPQSREVAVPGSEGLYVACLARPVGAAVTEGGLPAGAKAVSVFVVNRRPPAPDETRDEAFAFQVTMSVTADAPLLARPDLRGLASKDWDDCVADLQYQDAGEYAVGHNVATEAGPATGSCCQVRTCWIPGAEVERVAPASLQGVTLAMDALGALTGGADAAAQLGPLVTQYRAWIEAQAALVPASSARRRQTGLELLERARLAAGRIERGIALLADPECREAFRMANRAMAESARRRLGVMLGKDPAAVEPRWRPFQLAFLLMNLPGIADPLSNDRETVDLLFFPTGGGKTEAYLGLAAFTLLLRRLRNPGVTSAGVSVLMRYTLRLLTLDQLGRAATLICALERERQQDETRWGQWPFEIGLWVGRAATPNVMGRKGDRNPESARSRTLRFLSDDRHPSPIPLEDCPWCGTKFTRNSFRLMPDSDEPADLRISCVRHDCDFGRGVPLPILAVDEPIHRRLPCFLIATVDKFAGLPWEGRVGTLFGRVERSDQDGFYGPCDPLPGAPLPGKRLPPPELIIQDELHLISGPLGTMAGLYETALEELCVRELNGKRVRPKVIASTATVRRAQTQIRALFNRTQVDIFPPPGPSRRDSFFAETEPGSKSPARLYLGVAAQGRSPKVVMLRVYIALLSAAARQHAAFRKGEPSPVDPYLTLLGYFNSLRELGGARRLIEDEVRTRLAGYSSRKRVGEAEGLFVDRSIGYEPVELTSRINTAKVAEAKRRLGRPCGDKDAVDVAIATNMISVGLDISRLGLMVVFGQPKTSAEYIQATSRVGREVGKPGLVVTVLNVHKPRDRSHYERFGAYHDTFYRSVEAASVTPFSPRALDKGLAATVVGLARHGHTAMVEARQAKRVLDERTKLEFVIDTLAERAYGHTRELPDAEREALRQKVRDRAQDLLDRWSEQAQKMQEIGGGLQYGHETGDAQNLLFDFLAQELRGLGAGHVYMKFRANRSLRDVEPGVSLWVKELDGQDLQEERA